MKYYSIFIFLLVTVSTTIYSQGRDSKTNIALGNIEWGMTRKEVKSEFKSNKGLYTSYQIGETLYRYYYQNNGYDDNGQLDYVRLTIKGGGMYGVSEVVARTAFKDLLSVLRSQGFKYDGFDDISAVEFTRDELFEFHNEELDKTIYIALIGSQGNVFLNVGIMRYQGGKSEEAEDKKGF